MKIRFLFVIALAVSGLISVSAQNRVVVDKPANMIYVYDANEVKIFEAPVTVGANYGQKTKVGDRKTPEGTFKIKQIQNSSAWTHDFNDGGGVRKGAYGPFFHRLAVPGNNSIGIHGTCFPERVGQRGSEGCIRLKNEDLIKFNKLVKIGTEVKILPDNPQNPSTTAPTDATSSATQGINAGNQSATQKPNNDNASPRGSQKEIVGVEKSPTIANASSAVPPRPTAPSN